MWNKRLPFDKLTITEVANPYNYDSSFIFYETQRSFVPKYQYDFDGEIILLVDGGVFSAAEDYVIAFKRLGLGKIVGERTAGGAAGYSMSPVFLLPNSGMLIRMETEFLLNSEGKMNEVYRSEPDEYLYSEQIKKLLLAYQL
jgi:C-terminal processing protease CtpA/Prc